MTVIPAPEPGAKAEGLSELPEAMLEDAIAFLSLVRPEGYIALTAIPPERGPTHTETFAPGEGDAALHWLERHSAAGRNLYWTVNPTRERINSKASKQDIENLDWIHVDIDPDIKARSFHDFVNDDPRRPASRLRCIVQNVFRF